MSLEGRNRINFPTLDYIDEHYSTASQISLILKSGREESVFKPEDANEITLSRR
jgi:hypothetical protein